MEKGTGAAVPNTWHASSVAIIIYRRCTFIIIIVVVVALTEYSCLRRCQFLDGDNETAAVIVMSK